jgi:hypothetical protein
MPARLGKARPARGKAPLPAIATLRRQLASVAGLCDQALYGQPASAQDALQALPAAVRRLRFRAERCLQALDGEGLT